MRRLRDKRKKGFDYNIIYAIYCMIAGICSIIFLVMAFPSNTLLYEDLCMIASTIGMVLACAAAWNGYNGNLLKIGVVLCAIGMIGGIGLYSDYYIRNEAVLEELWGD